MRSVLTGGLIVVAFLFGGLEAGAIAVDDYSVAETNPAAAGYDLDLDHIYNFKNASAVAVDHYWILTAAHVADDGPSGNLTVGGETYYPQETMFHRSADLALVRYDKPFPGYYSLHDGEIYTGRFLKRYKELILAGYGFDGAVSAASFSEGSVRGILRWGTNKGSGESSTSADIVWPGAAPDGVDDVTTQCFKMPFNLSGTDYEAGGNVFDSGGPVFVEEGGEWKLTGINLYRYGSSADVYTENRAAMIHDYIGWIKSVIVDYDTDMDGLPDWWETASGESEASADPDNDGYTNYEEWLAYTNPTNGNSYLEITGFSAGMDIVFNSSSNRQYQIQSIRDPAGGSWTTEVDWFAGGSPASSGTVSTGSTSQLFRVRVRLP